MEGGKLIGSINLPSGVSASDLSSYVYIDAFDPEAGETGLSLNLMEALKFLCNLESMNYLSGLIHNFKVMEVPAVKIVRVGKSSVNVGALDLTSRIKLLPVA